MHPDNIKVEIKENNKWKELDNLTNPRAISG
jgi:hypothetical protein